MPRREKNIVQDGRKAPHDVSLVDVVRITYQHTYETDGVSMRLLARGQQQVALTRFTSPSIRVVDVTDPSEIVEVMGRVTAAAKTGGLQNASGVGFWSSQRTGG